MKKRFLILLSILILSLNNSLFAQSIFDDIEDTDDNFTGNIGISFLYPLENNKNIGANILNAALFSSVFIGVGYHFNIIKNIFCPGIYGDLHLSLLMLLFKNDGSDDDDKDKFFSFGGGLRVYNQIRIGPVDIQPFAGVSLLISSEMIMGLYKFGILVSYGSFGIEYSYHFTSLDYYRYYVNRFAFLIHLR